MAEKYLRIDGNLIDVFGDRIRTGTGEQFGINLKEANQVLPHQNKDNEEGFIRELKKIYG